MNAIEEFFTDRGYVLVKQLFNNTEIEIFRNSSKNLIAESEQIEVPKDLSIHKIMHKGSQFVLQNINDQNIIHRIVWAGAAEPNLVSISRQNKLLSIVAKLLQTDKADHIINSFHPKLIGSDVKFTPHQDEFHRRNSDPEWKNLNNDRTYVACITAIDPMNEENGGIKVIPYSHKIGRLLTREELGSIDLSTAIAVNMNPGDTICINQLTIHFSLENHGDNNRLTLINGFAWHGANHGIYPGEGSCELIDLIGNNSTIEQQVEDF